MRDAAAALAPRNIHENVARRPRATRVGSSSVRLSTGACAPTASPTSIGPMKSCSSRRAPCGAPTGAIQLTVDELRPCMRRSAYLRPIHTGDAVLTGARADRLLRLLNEAAAARPAGIALTWGLDLG